MNSEENICSICYEELNENIENNIENNKENINTNSNIYTLECNHCFHSSCIIKWFRNGHKNCPLCNDQTIDTSMNYLQKIETIKEIKKLGRKKSCPENIKKILQKIKKEEENFKNATKKFKEFMNSNKEIYKMEKNLRRDKYKPRRKIRMLEYKLLSIITIHPIYIKK